MKILHFYKYQGTGNDFIMIDNRSNFFPKNNTALVAQLCQRRFGVGADGLILLENEPGYAFRMVYYNADGKLSTMCGNGARCSVAFAQKLGMLTDSDIIFTAPDGKHQAQILGQDMYRIHMNDVFDFQRDKNIMDVNTGSPHYVEICKNIDEIDVKKEGAEIRYSAPYGLEGTNVNFVEQLTENRFKARTYERGVEDETFSCGTGAVAVAVSMHKMGKTKAENILIETKGGVLEVSFTPEKMLLGLKTKGYTNVWLTGAAQFVFEGEVECNY